MKISKLEKLSASVIFLIIFIILATALTINWYNGMGDNATYSDITLGISRTGKPVSQVLSTCLDYIFKEKLVTATPDKIANLKLNTHQYNENIFKFHFTPIQYLLAPFSKIIPVDILWESLTAFCFIWILYIGYFFLRNKKIPVIDAIIILTLISLHPAWNYSIFGQIYVDKIFLISAILCLFSLEKNKQNNILVIFGAFLSSLIIEKTTIIISIFLITYSILYWNKISSHLRFKMLLWGILLGSFGFVVIKYYLNNAYYSTFLSISSLINFKEYLSSYPNAFQNLITFSLINLPFLLLGAFEWRALIIAAIMMMPNIFGNIGGAEKVGWITHYHCTYFPFLIWAAMSGYTNLQKKWLNNNGKIIFYTLCLSAMVFFGNAEQLKNRSFNQFSISTAIYGSWPIRTLELIRDSYNPAGRYQSQKGLEKWIKENIPTGSKVSVPENLMLYLFQTNKVYYYPLGMDDADFIVLHINNNPALPKYSGIYTFLGEDNNIKIDTILFERMAKNGYNVDHPIVHGDVAIIKRK